MSRILIVDDEEDIRHLISGILTDEGYAVDSVSTSYDALIAVAGKPAPDLIILDIWLQGSEQGGIDVLKQIKATHPGLPVLMISGHGNIETAVTSLKYGAYDFLEKPFKSDRLLVLINRALENARLLSENKRLREKTEISSHMIGESSETLSIRHMIDKIAPTNSRVLITGDPGTGKDVVARQIHRKSGRAQGPYIAVNCAILGPDRLETELFGRAGGSPGMLEQAHEGTLLLDEISNMPMETQGKILRVLQEQRFRRVGDQSLVYVDVRVISTTNKDLQEEICRGRFREDLYYRLNVVPIALAPLRERGEDIMPLAGYFAEEYCRNAGCPVRAFSKEAGRFLQRHDWPGNVRQLRNVVEWIMIMGGGTDRPVAPEDLPPDLHVQPARFPDSENMHGFSKNREHSDDFSAFLPHPLREARELFERLYLMAQLERFGGNISKTAQFIGMERSALHRKIKFLSISKSTAANANPGRKASFSSSSDSSPAATTTSASRG